MLKNKLLIGLTALGLSANAQTWIDSGCNARFERNCDGWMTDIKGIAVNNNQMVGLRFMGGYGGEYSKWSGIASYSEGMFGNSTGLTLWANEAEALRISASGNLGIGSTNPTSKLQIEGNQNGWMQQIKGTSTNIGDIIGIKFNAGFVGEFNKWSGIANITDGQFGNSNGLAFYATQTERMRLTGDGRLGIGTSTPNANYRLDVIGNLHVDGRIDTKDVCVTPNGFCDFVFDENYKLMGLDSLKGYIVKNKHLPHFPSEKQIVKNGMSITDITLSQTRTIEELVLYTIKQQELIKKLEERIEAIETSKSK